MAKIVMKHFAVAKLLSDFYLLSWFHQIGILTMTSRIFFLQAIYNNDIYA